MFCPPTHVRSQRLCCEASQGKYLSMGHVSRTVHAIMMGCSPRVRWRFRRLLARLPLLVLCVTFIEFAISPWRFVAYVLISVYHYAHCQSSDCEDDVDCRTPRCEVGRCQEKVGTEGFRDLEGYVAVEATVKSVAHLEQHGVLVGHDMSGVPD